MTEDQIIDKIETAIKGYNFGDIKFLSDGNKTIAGFILCSCLIDHLATLRYGIPKRKKTINKGKPEQRVILVDEKVNASNYKRFINEYLKEHGYYTEALYEDLRCKLVHNYTIGKDSYDLAVGTNLHLKRWNMNSVVLDLKTFVKHLELVVIKYIGQLRNDPVIREIAVKRFKEVGIIGHQPFV